MRFRRRLAIGSFGRPRSFANWRRANSHNVAQSCRISPRTTRHPEVTLRTPWMSVCRVSGNRPLTPVRFFAFFYDDARECSTIFSLWDTARLP